MDPDDSNNAMRNIVVRPCADADVGSVHQLQVRSAEAGNSYGFVPADEDAIGAALGPYYLIAELHGRIVGFISGSRRVSDGLAVISKGEAYLEVDDLYLVPECRGQGLGSVLLQRLLDAARADGIAKALVYSAVKDIRPVLRFYERHGFKSWFVEMVADL